MQVVRRTRGFLNSLQVVAWTRGQPCSNERRATATNSQNHYKTVLPSYFLANMLYTAAGSSHATLHYFVVPTVDDETVSLDSCSLKHDDKLCRLTGLSTAPAYVRICAEHFELHHTYNLLYQSGSGSAHHLHPQRSALNA